MKLTMEQAIRVSTGKTMKVLPQELPEVLRDLHRSEPDQTAYDKKEVRNSRDRVLIAELYGEIPLAGVMQELASCKVYQAWVRECAARLKEGHRNGERDLLPHYLLQGRVYSAGWLAGRASMREEMKQQAAKARNAGERTE